MARYLLDENLSAPVGRALQLVGYAFDAVGDSPAPPKRSTDETIAQWCLEHDAVLVTSDRGKKNREIIAALATHAVAVVFVPSGWTPREQLAFFVTRGDQLNAMLASRTSLRIRVLRRGRLERVRR